MSRACICAVPTFVLVLAATSAAEDRPLIFGINRVGDEAVLYSPPGYTEDMYRRLREVGGTCVRLLASPRDIEHERGKRKWESIDEDLELSVKYGMEPIILICNTPAWASPTGEDTHLYGYKTELLPELSDFCTELAKRTRGKAKYFQIWNEQNGCSWHFHDGFNHADEYVPVLRAAYKGLKKGNPDCLVSLGSLDDAEGHGTIFMRKTYEEIAKQCPGERIFDVVSDHPYSDDPATMKKKLDAIREIMKKNGDGDMPIWITEYGWATGESMSLQQQAKNVAKFLEAMSQPDWSFLKASVYLSVSDFTGEPRGFGICDSNLRPRPSFYAFQGVPRFGKSPAHTITTRFPGNGKVEIGWQTVLEASGEAVLADASGKALARKESPSGKKHSVVLADLAPDADLVLTIRTKRTDTDGKAYEITSAPLPVHVPGPQIWNGDFEKGFMGGIGKGWTITGEAFCTDTPRVELGPRPRGSHAQTVFAQYEKGQTFDSTLWNYCAVKPGVEYAVTGIWCGQSRTTRAKVMARVGTRPGDSNFTEAGTMVWSEWKELPRRWQPFALKATPTADVIAVAIQCRADGPTNNGHVFLHLDDVRVEPPGAATAATQPQ